MVVVGNGGNVVELTFITTGVVRCRNEGIGCGINLLVRDGPEAGPSTFAVVAIGGVDKGTDTVVVGEKVEVVIGGGGAGEFKCVLEKAGMTPIRDMLNAVRGGPSLLTFVVEEAHFGPLAEGAGGSDVLGAGGEPRGRQSTQDLTTTGDGIFEPAGSRGRFVVEMLGLVETRLGAEE